jgi:hypothetical protein
MDNMKQPAVILDDKTLCRKQMTEQHEHKIGNKHETGTCSGYILLFIITQFIADNGKFWKILGY